MTGESSVGHRPAGAWEFDASVTRVFDDMLERSIPEYAAMRRIVTDVVHAARVRPLSQGVSSRVLDLGTSRGGAIADLLDVFGDAIRVVGVETSPPMLEAARRRFAGDERVEVVEMDLRRDLPVGPFDVALSVLTLQFTPVEHRLGILDRVRRRLAPGGAFVLVEKTLGETPRGHDFVSWLYREHKLRAGYSPEDVDRKALALEGRLVPLRESENLAMLRSAGFAEVQPVWRSLGFAAWVAWRDAP